MRASLLNAAGFLVLGGVTLWLTRKQIRNLLRNRTLKGIDKDGTPQDLADDLDVAMNESGPFGLGIGTDVARIISTLSRIPHRDFWEDVQKMYKNLEKGDHLWNDLKGELTPEEQEMVKAMIEALPETARKARKRDPEFYDTQMLAAWAHRAHWALKLYNPYLSGVIDEAQLLKVFEEIPVVKAIPDLNQEYLKIFKESLYSHLLDELSDEDFEKLKTKMMNKPDAKGKSFFDVARGA